MAFIRCNIVMAALCFCVLFANGQEISYPTHSSQLLKATAADAAMLLDSAMPGSHFSTLEYANLPQKGIVFIYDTTISDNLACKVICDGSDLITFTAAEDNGLCFGLYKYLQQLGFRFYLPGSIWENTPLLTTVYKKTDTTFTSSFKYNGWFISGGYNRWIMDDNNNFSWDLYTGENGHNWALYQRRNGMTGKYRFVGHRGDIMTGSYLSTLQNNPCYVANNNNSRVANPSSVPDINNIASMEFWAGTIQEKYTGYKNNIFNNTSLYTNQFRKIKYNYANIGIEVPDGAKWGNTIDNAGCPGSGYPSESDQHFILSNYTSKKIGATYPKSSFQVYAYSRHANIPSAGIVLNKNIDVQLIPEVYQTVTSTNGLRNRWYHYTKNISEYNYLNLSGWSGETPSFDFDEFLTTVQIAKDNKSQGLVWETSPAKFASLPYLFAANSSLIDNANFDSTLQQFCNDMFGDASKTILQLLHFWADKKNMVQVSSNKYRLPFMLQLLNKADEQTKNASVIIKDRLRELKAYLHYMILYFEWVTDQRPNEAKQDKAGLLCMYLASINKMQLVNSYFLITTITSKYDTGGNFYKQYNCISGMSYQNGNLPQITAYQIENNFLADQARYGNIINNYSFEEPNEIENNFEEAHLKAKEIINVEVKYTNGIDYYGNSTFYFDAEKSGTFSINYQPTFDLPEKGYINFLVEKIGDKLNILNDLTLDKNSKEGNINISIPSAGAYKLTITSKYKSSVKIQIITNNINFYKSGAFFGNNSDNYSNVNDLPGFFYIPATIDKVYFSISNSNPGGKVFATEEKINREFAILDNEGNNIKAWLATPNDSALFYINIPKTGSGKFYRITQRSNYGLVFSNISNYLWIAQPKPAECTSSAFNISVIKEKEKCIIRLTAKEPVGQTYLWTVTDLGNTYNYGNYNIIDLPEYISPNALVTLSTSDNCSVTKKLRDDAGYLKAIQACANGAVLPTNNFVPTIYPNPSPGYFKCIQNGNLFKANKIEIINVHGVRVAGFNQADNFNISNLPAGIYLYKMMAEGIVYNGKLVKL